MISEEGSALLDKQLEELKDADVLTLASCPKYVVKKAGVRVYSLTFNDSLLNYENQLSHLNTTNLECAQFVFGKVRAKK